jgi:hypothetical protein
VLRRSARSRADQQTKRRVRDLQTLVSIVPRKAVEPATRDFLRRASVWSTARSDSSGPGGFCRGNAIARPLPQMSCTSGSDVCLVAARDVATLLTYQNDLSHHARRPRHAVR